MSKMKILRSFAVASAAFFIACNPVSAQWQTPDHSVPIGRGSGTGFKFAAPGTAGQALVSTGAATDPAFGNVTSVGTITTGTWQGTPVAANYGGTGQSTYTIGDLLQASATSTLSKLAAVATGNVLISGGVGTVSSWGKVGLTTHVTGTLPVANGGTNCAVASGTCVDNISGFASTGFLTRTGAGTYAFQSANNGITRANLAQVPANSYSGNPTTSLANETAFTASSLTLKAAPVSGDVVIIEDSAASFGLKKTTVGALASAGSVASVNGKTGAVVWSVVRQTFCASGCTTTIAGGGSGTYTPTTGMVYAIVEARGGGGGGGGTIGNASNITCGGGGGSGGYSKSVFTAAAIGASKAIAIGIGGAGGSAGSLAAATAGGDTTFGTTLLVAKGGSGGSGGQAGVQAGLPGSGGVPGTGDMSEAGYIGSGGSSFIGTTVGIVSGGGGGPGGGSSGYNAGGTGANAGANSGGGGGAACSVASGTNFAGGAGASSWVFVTEYLVN